MGTTSLALIVFASSLYRAGSLQPLRKGPPRSAPPRMSTSIGSLCVYGNSEDEVWLSAGVAAVQEQNDEVLSYLGDLRKRRFFRLYSADLLASCSYMPTSEEPCELGSCEVDAAEDVPLELIERDEAESTFELDSWARWDQPSDFTEYYDLVENGVQMISLLTLNLFSRWLGWQPHTAVSSRGRCCVARALWQEGHTEYDGSALWDFIHTKICFQKDVEQRGNAWKGDFNRCVSGLHSAVAASIVRDMESRGDTGACAARAVCPCLAVGPPC